MKHLTFLCFLVFYISFVPSVFAIGVTPARKEVFFEPNLDQEFAIKVINNQERRMSVSFSVEGDLSNFVSFYEDVILFDSSESEKLFKYTLNLPEKIDIPGKHDINIVVQESILDGEDSMIGGKAAVISQLRVIVPYPNEYLEADLLVSISEERVLITSPVFNLGVDMAEINANFKIFDPNDNLISEGDSGSVFVDKGQKKNIFYSWSASFVGSYIVFATLDYAGKSIKLNKTFDVGDMFVKVEDIFFTLDIESNIAKVEIVAQSGWNNEIEGISANVFVNDIDGKVVSTLKTPSEPILPFSNKTLVAYWDTNGILEGSYEILVVLDYGYGKTSEKSFFVDLREGNIEKFSDKKSKTSYIFFISLIMAILVLICVILLVVFIKRGQRRHI